jgi:hypothetical protein
MRLRVFSLEFTMKHSAEEMPEESIVLRSLLESLEPRQLLSGAPVTQPPVVVEFSMPATNVSYSQTSQTSQTSTPVQISFREFAIAPLGARRAFDGFGSSFNDPFAGVVIFVTPWSLPGNATTRQPADVSMPVNDAKPSPAPSNASNVTDSSDASESTEPMKTLTVESHDTNSVAQIVQSTRADQPATSDFSASAIIEDAAGANANNHATTTKTPDANASHDLLASRLTDFNPDDLKSSAPQGTVSRAWYEVLDRDLLHSSQDASNQSPITTNERATISMKQGDQAEPLRALVRNFVRRPDVAKHLSPTQAAIESSPISIWQRIAMVTLTGGALVTNWYVRRRRARLAIHGPTRVKVGRHPHLP